MIMNWLLRVADPWPVVKLWGVAGLAVALGTVLHRRLYYLGFSKAQEGAERKILRPLRGPLSGFSAGCRPRSASSSSRTCGCSSATTPSGAS